MPTWSRTSRRELGSSTRRTGLTRDEYMEERKDEAVVDDFLAYYDANNKREEAIERLECETPQQRAMRLKGKVVETSLPGMMYDPGVVERMAGNSEGVAQRMRLRFPEHAAKRGDRFDLSFLDAGKEKKGEETVEEDSDGGVKLDEEEHSTTSNPKDVANQMRKVESRFSKFFIEKKEAASRSETRSKKSSLYSEYWMQKKEEAFIMREEAKLAALKRYAEKEAGKEAEQIRMDAQVAVHQRLPTSKANANRRQNGNDNANDNSHPNGEANGQSNGLPNGE